MPAPSAENQHSEAWPASTHFRRVCRVFHSDSGMGWDLSPPSGWGHMGGDRGSMGGDLCVIRDMFEMTFNFRKYMTLKQFFHHYTYE